MHYQKHKHTMLQIQKLQLRNKIIEIDISKVVMMLQYPKTTHDTSTHEMEKTQCVQWESLTYQQKILEMDQRKLEAGRTIGHLSDTSQLYRSKQKGVDQHVNSQPSSTGPSQTMLIQMQLN